MRSYIRQKAAETKGADMVYLAYMTKNDPDVIVLGYAAKKIAADNLISVPACIFRWVKSDSDTHLVGAMRK